MKFYRNFLLAVVSMVVLYIVFLIVSDFNVIHEKIFDFKTDYLPIILLKKLTRHFMFKWT